MIIYCPKCNEKSYIMRPCYRLMRRYFTQEFYTGDVYEWHCHNEKCSYTSERFSIKTKIGHWFDLPWWRRLFTTIPYE